MIPYWRYNINTWDSMKDIPQIQIIGSHHEKHLNEWEEIELKSWEHIKINKDLQSSEIMEIVDEEWVWFLFNTWRERNKESISANFSHFLWSFQAGEYTIKYIQSWPYPIAYDTRKKYYEYFLYFFDQTGKYQNWEVPISSWLIISHWDIWNFTMIPWKVHYSQGKKSDSNKITYSAAKNMEEFYQNRLGNRINTSLYSISLIQEKPELGQKIQSYFTQKWWVPTMTRWSKQEYLFDENFSSIRHIKNIRALIEKVLNDWDDYIEVDTLWKYSIRIHKSESCTTWDIHMMIWAKRTLFERNTWKPAKLKVLGNILKWPLKVKWNSDKRMIIQTSEWQDYYFDLQWNHISIMDSFGIEIWDYKQLGSTYDGIHPGVTKFWVPYIYDWKNINWVWNKDYSEIWENDTIGGVIM